jgi:hypothetical protein
MLVRWLLAALVVVALVTAGCGGSDDNSTSSSSTAATNGGPTQGIIGQWAGTLTQAGLPPFRVAALIFSGAGKVAYTGIDCAGDWKPDSGGGSSGSYAFTETINQGAGGACKGTGTVHLDRLAPKRLRYRFEGGGVSSQGILRPAPTRVWAAIFREAGVELGTGNSEPCPKGAPVCGASASAAPTGAMSK